MPRKASITPIRLVVWTDRTRVPFVRETLDAGGDGIALVGVAAPDAAVVASVANELDAPSITELRNGLPVDGVDAIWLAADADLPPDTIRWLRSLRAVVVSTEPHPQSLDDLDDPQATGIDPLLSWRAGPTWIAATDILDHFGRVDAIGIVEVATPAHGSLLTRLVDAADLADRFCSPIETVTASIQGGGRLGATTSLRGLEGHLTAHMRGADGRAAAITVSSNGASWRREVTLLGPAGRLRLVDGEFEWLDPAGQPLDSHRGGPSDPARLAAQRLREAVAGTAPSISAPIAPRLGIAQTALLSCRTGDAESCHHVTGLLSRG